MKKALIILALLLCPLIAQAQYVRHDNVVWQPIGIPASGVPVYVCQNGASGTPCSSLVTIYCNSTGLVTAIPFCPAPGPIANPVTTDSGGNYHYYTAPGRVQEQIIVAGQVSTTPDIVISADPTAPNIATDYISKLTPVVDVRAYSGADMGAQIQAALNAAPAGATVTTKGLTGAYSAASGLTIATSGVTLEMSIALTAPPVTVTANNVTIRCLNQFAGNGFAQSATGTSWLQATSVSGLKIEGCAFTGIVGTSFTFSNNNAIRLTGVSGAKLINNSFTGWQGDAIQVLNSSDVETSGNHANAVNGSVVRFMGVNRGKIYGNTARATSLPIGTATIGIIVDSVGGTGYANSTNINIENNVVQSYPNYQAITLHDCQYCTVVGNTMSDVSTGVALVRSSATDLVQNITISGNTYGGTTTPGQCGGCTNIGINITGADAVNIVKNVAVTGNHIFQANAAMQVSSWGGIVSTFADNVNIAGNDLTGNYGSGITLSSSATTHHVAANIINSSQRVGGASFGLYIPAGATAVDATVAGNRFTAMDYAIRADASALNVQLGFNQYFNVTERVHNINNFNINPLLDGNLSLSNNASNNFIGLSASNGVQTSTAKMTAIVTNGNTGEVQFGITDASPYGWRFVGTNVPVFIAGTAPTDSLRVETTGAVSFNGGAQIANSTKLPQVGTPTVGQAACIKAAGPPVLIGFCSTTPTSGTCTCN